MLHSTPCFLVTEMLVTAESGRTEKYVSNVHGSWFPRMKLSNKVKIHEQIMKFLSLLDSHENLPSIGAQQIKCVPSVFVSHLTLLRYLHTSSMLTHSNLKLCLLFFLIMLVKHYKRMPCLPSPSQHHLYMI